ncbi:hypothetical protein ABPG77_008234 [Micractinium sp. CCAP 211/92]
MSDSESGLPDDAPAILRAACAGDLAALEAILADTPAAICETEDQGACAIHYAAANGHLPCVQALLAAGADPSVPAAHGAAPLALAASYGHTPILRALLAAGADMEATCPLSRDIDAPMTALQWAAWEGHEECLRALLAAGASLEPQRGAEFYPALSLAAGEGHKGCVCALLEAGAPVEARGSDGNTALIVACYGGHEDCMAALAAAGADLEARGSRGTALQVAVACRQGVCATALVGLGARTTEVKVLEAAQAAAAAAAAQLLAEEEAQQQQAARAAAKAAKRQRQQERRHQEAGGKAAENAGSVAGPPEMLQQEAADEAEPPAKTDGCDGAAAMDLPTPRVRAEPPLAGNSSASSSGSSTDKTAGGSADGDEVEQLMQALGLSDSIASSRPPGGSFTGLGGSPERGGIVASGASPASPACNFAAPATPAASPSSHSQPSAARKRSAGATAPEDLACPITHGTMRQPVLAADGHTYEHAAIHAWVARQTAEGRAPCSPLTGLPLEHLLLTPNQALARQIQALHAAAHQAR